MIKIPFRKSKDESYWIDSNKPYKDLVKDGTINPNKYHYLNGPHKNKEGIVHYDYHETSRMGTKDRELREKYGLERLDKSNKIGHIESPSARREKQEREKAFLEKKRERELHHLKERERRERK
ncbi:hypothetical protein [Saccharolobus islandicus]|uniref:Uncharacterized protein n=2 Tax=Saccharolobus islandicus TaxID=43080 RepID=C3MWE0_SACI4|nr:hypothetical protein [Sulfolobus islandicus]ACP37598.1 hypothetical protein M1425_0788 [Sulfolobus islandicus M.14.25]ACP54741.1 hypothetical protein M1627_0793 [Sulfolobus islandicus M.16.27]